MSSPSNFSILFITMLVLCSISLYGFCFPYILTYVILKICCLSTVLQFGILMLPIYDLSFCNFILLWCIFNALNVLSSFDSLSFWKSVVYQLFYSLVFWCSQYMIWVFAISFYCDVFLTLWMFCHLLIHCHFENLLFIDCFTVWYSGALFLYNGNISFSCYYI